jgi:hypothetical protein
LLLATAGVAGAQPWNRPAPVTPDHHLPYDRGNDEGARRGDYGARPVDENRFVPLVKDLTPTSPQMYIPLSHEMGRFHRLRIERQAGLPFIRGVTVEFMNGEIQRVALDRQLEPGSGVVYVDLNGGERELRRIVLDVRPDPRASFSVVGI